MLDIKMVQVNIDREYLSDRRPGGNAMGFTMDNYLVRNINDYLIKAVKNKWDGCMLFTGMEGSGKTTLAGACAALIDPNFSLDSVVFTVQQFFDAVDKAPPESVILWDEMVFGGLSTEALSSIQTALIKKMTTIRKKRLYIFLVIPSIFLLRMYFAIFRTRAMIDCYSPDGIERGKFRFYSFDTKRKLFFHGKKTWNMMATKADFFGSFVNTDGYFYDLEEYDEKKEAAIKTINDKDIKEDGTPTQRMKVEQFRFTSKVLLQRVIQLTKLSSDRLYAEYKPWFPWKPASIKTILREDLSNGVAEKYFKQLDEDFMRATSPGAGRNY